MRVALVSSFPPEVCGIADFASDLVRALLSLKGTEVVLVTPSRAAREDSPPGLGVVPLASRSEWGWHVARKIRSAKPDIIHVQSTAFLYARRFNLFPLFHDGTPLVMTVHDTAARLRQLHTAPTLWIGYAMANELIVHSRHVGQALRQRYHISESKIRFIHHGVDINRFTPDVSPEPFLNTFGIESGYKILYFGFLRRDKGLEDLIAGFELFAKENPDAQLIIAGDTPHRGLSSNFGQEPESEYKAYISARVAQSKACKRIRLAGYVPSELLPSCIASGDVLAFPYHDTSQSGPLRIAMAAGRPIVATDVGSNPEVILDRETGLLIPTRNPWALRDTFSLLHQSSTLRDRLARNARRFAVDHLDWRNVAQRHAELYRTMLSGVTQ